MKEAHLWEKLDYENIRCQNCAHYCVIAPAKKGFCGVRKNIRGKLFSLNYGIICAIEIDPIEKKPLFHFYPGTQSLSIAAIGCNFKCYACQNWRISQADLVSEESWGQELSPKQIIEIAKKNNCPSISYTYTEPTVFSEFALETMILAKKNRLKNIWVSNGYLSKKLIEKVSPFLDAVNIDLKSFDDDFYKKYCSAKLRPVLECLKKLKELGVWIEVTTLVIPTLNDKKIIFENIAKFIKNDLGEETPWHITQFCGEISWKLQQIPDTPQSNLIAARDIGINNGLKYVYTGNIPGQEGEDTFCPKCKQKMIDRYGYFIKRYDKKGKCAKCKQDLNIIE